LGSEANASPSAVTLVAALSDGVLLDKGRTVRPGGNALAYDAAYSAKEEILPCDIRATQYTTVR
jgi:hypothetical protein